MILCIYVLSVVISPFSFLILLIWFFSLCFLMSLANGLSILFILWKNQRLVLLIFAMVSFVSFAFISALSFKISFLLLTLGFFISSFSSCFRCRVFSNESILCMRWPKYWSFSFSTSPSKEHPGLISFRMDRLDLLAVQGTLKSLLQHHSSKASILRSVRLQVFIFMLIWLK